MINVSLTAPLWTPLFNAISNDVLNDTDTSPSDKPHQDFSNQSEVWRTKVFHGYEPGVAQGSHHFGEIYEKTRKLFALPKGIARVTILTFET